MGNFRATGLIKDIQNMFRHVVVVVAFQAVSKTILDVSGEMK